MNRAVQVQEKHARENAIKEVKSAVAAKFEEQDVEEEVLNQVNEILSKLVKSEVRRLITEEKYVLMAVVLTKFVHFLLKQTCFHVHTDLDYLRVDKLKRLASVH